MIEKITSLEKVLTHLKHIYVGKDQIIDLLGLSLIAGENIFLYGPPGTAKSAIVKSLSKQIENGKNFDYLLTKFTEPNEIFGPINIQKLREGELVTNIENMLPEASIVFLDELFNANSAILNSLLTSLNEKTFRKGKETFILPTLMFISASNHLPDEEALEALFDRFVVRVKCDYVEPALLIDVLTKGRNLQKNTLEDKPTITIEDIVELQSFARTLDTSPIHQQYSNVVKNLRNAGISISDRRAVKLLNLIASSAILSHRDYVIDSDLWVLKHIWDNEEEIEILESVIDEFLNHLPTNDLSHSQALQNHLPNPEELHNQLKKLVEEWNNDEINLEQKNNVKDKLRILQSRIQWLKNQEKKEYIQQEIDKLWSQILISI